MVDLVEDLTYPAGIYQIETVDAVEGGAGGVSNRQALALAKRTAWLKNQQELHAAAVDPHPQYMTAAESDAVIAAAVAALVASSPAALDTLNELALALGNDPNFAATITAALGTKLTQVQTDALYLKLTGGDLTGPITQKFSGLYWQGTPAGGAFVRKYADVANAATVGGIEDSTVYNCAVDPVTGVWAGRDVADLCWLEKWSDTGGQKEYWFAPTAAAGAVPVWARAFTLDIPAGKIVFSDGTKQSTLPKFNIQQITTSGNFTTPSNITIDTVFKITLIGPGGGGGGCSGVSVAQGGGAGGAASFLISGLQPSTNYPVTIGAIGVGGAAGNNNGTAGGTTSIVINGTTYSVNGGALGTGTAASQYQYNPGAQGAVSASITSLPSAVVYKQTGTLGFYLAALNYFAAAGASLLPWGNGGYSGAATGAGVGYGAGGTGATAGQGGGSGAPSEVIIEWIA